METIKARDALVRTRASLVSHIRGTVKAMGCRVRTCSTEAFASCAPAQIPAPMQEALGHLVETIREISGHIKQLDKQIGYLCQDRYPETKYLLQVAGVGPITALAFVLTLETPDRFEKSRTVGAYLGLTPRRDQSGETDRQMPITKAGNGYLRRLLVGCAQYILGPFGPDCDLRRYGARIAVRGGKRAKKCAAVAVARSTPSSARAPWPLFDASPSTANFTSVRCSAVARPSRTKVPRSMRSAVAPCASRKQAALRTSASARSA